MDKVSNCENCYFWRMNNGDSRMGECRYDPPKIVNVTFFGSVPQTGFPSTLHSQWCGKYRRKEIGK